MMQLTLAFKALIVAASLLAIAGSSVSEECSGDQCRTSQIGLWMPVSRQQNDNVLWVTVLVDDQPIGTEQIVFDSDLAQVFVPFFTGDAIRLLHTVAGIGPDMVAVRLDLAGDFLAQISLEHLEKTNPELNGIGVYRSQLVFDASSQLKSNPWGCDDSNNLCTCLGGNAFPICTDADRDGINDTADNCPADPNPQQEDCDFDQIGDVCDDNNMVDELVSAEPLPDRLERQYPFCAAGTWFRARVYGSYERQAIERRDCQLGFGSIIVEDVRTGSRTCYVHDGGYCDEGGNHIPSPLCTD